MLQLLTYSRQTKQEHWYKYFGSYFISLAVSKSNVWKLICVEIIPSERLERKQPIVCCLPRASCKKRHGASWGASGKSMLCHLGDPLSDLCAKQLLALLYARSNSRFGRNKELPLGMSDFCMCKQIMACPHITGYLKLQNAPQRCRKFPFGSHLYYFRSVLGKTFLLDCSMYAIAIVSLL